MNKEKTLRAQPVSCGCGHCDAAGLAPDAPRARPGDKEAPSAVRGAAIAIAASAAAAGLSLLLPEGAARSILLLAAVLIAGAPIFLRGLRNIARLDLEETALLTVAVAAAAVIGELPEALLVTALFRVGGILEDLAVARSRREVEAITGIIPENANLLGADGSTAAVGARELAVGSRILVKSGERVPVDSVVLAGSSSVDASSLTGESAPREIRPGDTVLSGMVNLGGVLTCETAATFEDSTASRIVEMVRDSAARKGSTERLISRFARVYTPTVIAAAAVVAVVPPLLGLGPYTEWISRSLVFLVASCPCALVISIPLSFFAGIGACSKRGVLVKGSRYIEALAGARAVVFDKTGTLTSGRLSVSAVHPAQGVDGGEVLRLAAACERRSNHPVARAVAEAYEASGGPGGPAVESCEELTSYGMRAATAEGELLCGSDRLMERFGVDVAALPAGSVYVAKNGEALGSIEVFDHPRPDAASAVAELGAMGVTRTAMLTGDGESAAKKTAELTGVGEVRAGLLPADKVAAFEQIQEGVSGKVLFVGDGINDSPVLARADAGVAMGLASDAAIEAADVVLLSDRLSSLPQAIRIARRTSRLARFNIAFALGVKLLVFVLALFGAAGMWMAVFADVGVSILSVLNATRALRFR